MKIKRFTAANMQTGLKTIGETLGPEAVILSNRRLADGLEIVAGVDEHEFEIYQAGLPEPSEESDIIKAAASSGQRMDKETMTQLFSVMSDKNKKAFSDSGVTPTKAPVVNEPKPDVKKSKTTAQVFETRIEDVDHKDAELIEKAAAPKSNDIDLLRQEIDGLKDLLKEQTEHLKEPTPSTDISPQYERLEARLQTLGFTNRFTEKLLAHYDREDSLDHNWRKLMARLSTAIPAPMYEPMASGGVYAFTGPTGAGKTTTIAKLAAHAVKDYGIDSVAVVSLDWFQVGGQEILKSVCEILSVEFHPLTEKQSLVDTLDQLSEKRLVLIDTSGSREALQNWNRLMQQSDLANRIQPVLVLPATMMPSAVSQFVQNHSNAAFTGTILTKLDESACFGGVLEPVIKHRWPLWYCTMGQNIPQDIEQADGLKLTKRLVAGLQPEKARLATAS